MLNKVWIFEASVFNSELNSNLTNSKLDSWNWSQGDSQDVKVHSKDIWSSTSWSNARSASCRWYQLIFTPRHIRQLYRWVLSRFTFTKLACRSQHQTVLQENSRERLQSWPISKAGPNSSRWASTNHVLSESYKGLCSGLCWWRSTAARSFSDYVRSQWIPSRVSKCVVTGSVRGRR